MAILESTIAPSSEAYKANRAGMLALISRMRALEERTRAASAAAKDRFREELLTDRRNRFFSAYMVKAKLKMKIDVNRENLQKVVG